MIEGSFSDVLHGQKYRNAGESFVRAMDRVSNATDLPDSERNRYNGMLQTQQFMPAGRIQLAAGSPRRVTPFNCFVSDKIEDSFVEGRGSIMRRAEEAATTMRMGGGIGYDFSTLRPRGATIHKLGSKSTGPVSFMEIFDAIGRCTASAGHRRGAQMGVLRVDHPDIVEFVEAKQNRDRLTGFNVSVAVTDEFMRAVEDGTEFVLRHRGSLGLKWMDARWLWDKIMRSTWQWAEPGVLFIDTINSQNNLRYCEWIAATNPCGEQPLPPNGACLLASFNLVRYLLGSRGDYRLDFDLLRTHVHTAVKAMDSVIDWATFPLYEQEAEAKSKRRMGLGVTGMANALEALGSAYGSATFLERQEAVMRVIRDEAYYASAHLAREKGPFPAFEREGYMDSPFVRTLPTHVLNAINAHGIRNSHLLSVAPTGTISLCAGNVSSGIEPVFAEKVRRRIHTPDGQQEFELQDYGCAELGVEPKTADSVTVEEHLAVLTVAQRYVDSAVSKTCNVGPEVTFDQFKEIYHRAWLAGAKGCTTFRSEGSRAGVLEEASSCFVDPATGRKECA